MNYTVEYTKTAVKQLKDMDKKIASFILAYIEAKLVNCENPRIVGKPLQASLSDKWRYRVGDYRILAKIDDHMVVVTAVETGHRSEIYK